MVSNLTYHVGTGDRLHLLQLRTGGVAFFYARLGVDLELHKVSSRVNRYHDSCSIEYVFSKVEQLNRGISM